MAQLARDAGKLIEPGLFEQWGGRPSIQRLRFRGKNNPRAVERRHEQLERVTGWRLPSADEEDGDPDAADAEYADALCSLRDLTRDREQFRLLFEENMNYGFWRNLLGLRRWGIVISIGTVITAGCIFALGRVIRITERSPWDCQARLRS